MKNQKCNKCNLHIIDCDCRQKSTIDHYYKKGYLKNGAEEIDLKRSFYPFIVPKGLTKLQIRRRINKIRKYGSPDIAVKELLGNRLEILINGKFILGANFKGDVPDSKIGLKKLLNELLLYEKF